jgi:hypothetical protein
MRCSKCGSDNREGRKFCASCGAPIIPACPRCHAINVPNEQFCGECGASLSAPASSTVTNTVAIRVNTETTTSEEIADERKIVTALFADLTGSTAMLETLDPEEGRAIVEPLLQIMVDAVHRLRRLPRADHW